jgi:hypothetical protein
MTSKYDLRGRKAILAFWGLAKWGAVLKKVKCGAPVIQEPDGTWVASSSELDKWSSSGVQAPFESCFVHEQAH